MAQDKQKNIWHQVVQKVLPSELNIKSITEKEWDEKYKNLFRQLAEEGFPLVTYDNYKSSDYYAYSYTVISSLRKMSKRKVVNMMVKARREIKEQYGTQHSLFNIVHNSFENKKKNRAQDALAEKFDLKRMFASAKAKKEKQPRRTFMEMMRATGSRVKTGMSNLAKKPFVAKPVRAVRRYGLAALMFFTSLGGVKVSANNDAQPLGGRIKQNTTTTMTPRKQTAPRTVEMRQVKNFSGIYNGLHIDSLQKLMPENVSMVFMSSNKANATVGGQSITTAKEFGPMLNKMSELQSFFAANDDKYPEIQKAIVERGINSKAFEKAWMKVYSPELMHNVVKHVWAKKYQPTFDKLAEAGFPKITVDNYANPENFGYSAAVISTLGQTSGKTTVDIMLKAKQEAGAKASLDQIVDASYEVKHQKWGLKTRYFGRNESKGEMAMNQDVRQAVREAQQQERAQETRQTETDASSQHDVSARELVFEIKNMDFSNIIHENTDLSNNQGGVRESTALPKADTLYMHEINADSLIVNSEDSVTERNLAEMLEEAQADSAEEQHQPVIDFSMDLMSASDWAKAKELLQSYDIDFNDTISLETGRVQLEEEKARLEGELATIGTGVYKDMKLNFADLYPENAGHVYESVLNPTIKDSKSIYSTNAMGLYQFNMSNTMKLLANALADEFPDLKAAKDAHKGGCRNADYERAWVKYSTGPNRARFERRQFEFMFDKFYQNVFDNLHERYNAPVITKENYNLPEYWAYTASTMSLVNQNPVRSAGMTEKAIVAAIEAEAQTAANRNEVAVIKDLLYGRNHTKEERKLGKVRLKHYVSEHQPNWTTVAAASYDVRARQWRSLKSRYLGNRHDKGEKDLVAKVDRFLREAPTMEARLSQVNSALNAVELAQHKVASPLLFWATAQNLQECEAVQADAIKVEKLERLAVLEQHAGNMKQLKQTRQRIQKTLSNAVTESEQDQAFVKTPRVVRRDGGQNQNSNNDDQYV